MNEWKIGLVNMSGTRGFCVENPTKENKTKGDRLINWIRSAQIGAVLLTETKAGAATSNSDTLSHYLQFRLRNWQIFEETITGQARCGVAIALNPDIFIDAKKQQQRTAERGRYLEVICKLKSTPEKKLRLVVVYAPADGEKSRRDFFDDLQPIPHYESEENDVNAMETIIGGDWNVVLNEERDEIRKQNMETENRQQHSPPTRNRTSADALRAWLATSGALIDAAEYSGTNLSHTFFHRSTQYSARLDRWYCSRDLARATTVTVEKYQPVDHAAVTLSFAEEKVEQGHDRWMMNVNVLQNQDCVRDVNEIIHQVRMHAAESAMPASERWELLIERLNKCVRSWCWIMASDRRVAREIAERELTDARENWQELTTETQRDEAKVNQLHTKLQEATRNWAKFEEYELEGLRQRYRKFNFQNGDQNTKRLHAIVKARTKKQLIRKLKPLPGELQTLSALETAQRYYAMLYAKRKTSSRAQKRLLNRI